MAEAGGLSPHSQKHKMALRELDGRGVHYPRKTIYSEALTDAHGIYLYRHVTITASQATSLCDLWFDTNDNKDKPCKRLLLETEWRALGIRQSAGWQHFELLPNYPHVLLFRKLVDANPSAKHQQNEGKEEMVEEQLENAKKDVIETGPQKKRILTKTNACPEKEEEVKGKTNSKNVGTPSFKKSKNMKTSSPKPGTPSFKKMLRMYADNARNAKTTNTIEARPRSKSRSMSTWGELLELMSPSDAAFLRQKKKETLDRARAAQAKKREQAKMKKQAILLTPPTAKCTNPHMKKANASLLKVVALGEGMTVNRLKKAMKRSSLA